MRLTTLADVAAQYGNTIRYRYAPGEKWVEVMVISDQVVTAQVYAGSEWREMTPHEADRSPVGRYVYITAPWFPERMIFPQGWFWDYRFVCETVEEDKESDHPS